MSDGEAERWRELCKLIQKEAEVREQVRQQVRQRQGFGRLAGMKRE